MCSSSIVVPCLPSEPSEPSFPPAAARGPRPLGKTNHRRTLFGTELARWLPAGALLFGCSDLPSPPIGRLSLGLSSGAGEERFQLGSARFALTGDQELTLEPEDAAVVDTFDRSLPEGSYRLELLEGWQLQRMLAGSARAVDATLISPNPVDFQIRTGEVTFVTLQFRTQDGEVALDSGGTLRIGIDVDGSVSRHVLFSEWMRNPAVLSDSQGEWFELYNAGAETLNLDGCSISRDNQSLELTGEFPVAAGDVLVFANGEDPGFAPDVVYSGLSLPNSGTYRMTLQCDGVVLDEVEIDSSTMPDGPGQSASLGFRAHSVLANDSVAAWCPGNSSYNGDFGTPGDVNPDCP